MASAGSVAVRGPGALAAVSAITAVTVAAVTVAEVAVAGVAVAGVAVGGVSRVVRPALGVAARARHPERDPCAQRLVAPDDCFDGLSAGGTDVLFAAHVLRVGRETAQRFLLYVRTTRAVAERRTHSRANSAIGEAGAEHRHARAVHDRVGLDDELVDLARAVHPRSCEPPHR